MNDSFWNVFSDTGDPVCYLLYKANSSEKVNTNEKMKKEISQPPECAKCASD